jgi:hypothetical protein
MVRGEPKQRPTCERFPALIMMTDDDDDDDDDGDGIM